MLAFSWKMNFFRNIGLKIFIKKTQMQCNLITSASATLDTNLVAKKNSIAVNLVSLAGTAALGKSQGYEISLIV